MIGLRAQLSLANMVGRVVTDGGRGTSNVAASEMKVYGVQHVMNRMIIIIHI